MDTAPDAIVPRSSLDDTGGKAELEKAKELLKPQDGAHPDSFSDGFFSEIDFRSMTTAHRVELGIGISLNQQHLTGRKYSKKDEKKTTVRFACVNRGFPDGKENASQRDRQSTKCGCPAGFSIRDEGLVLKEEGHKEGCQPFTVKAITYALNYAGGDGDIVNSLAKIMEQQKGMTFAKANNVIETMVKEQAQLEYVPEAMIRRIYEDAKLLYDCDVAPRDQPAALIAYLESDKERFSYELVYELMARPRNVQRSPARREPDRVRCIPFDERCHIWDVPAGYRFCEAQRDHSRHPDQQGDSVDVHRLDS